jgi:hypothetical protein
MEDLGQVTDERASVRFLLPPPGFQPPHEAVLGSACCQTDPILRRPVGLWRMVIQRQQPVVVPVVAEPDTEHSRGLESRQLNRLHGFIDRELQGVPGVLEGQRGRETPVWAVEHQEAIPPQDPVGFREEPGCFIRPEMLDNLAAEDEIDLAVRNDRDVC